MKNVISAAVVFLVMAFASQAVAAEAGDWRVGVTLASKHFIDAPEELGEFREDNLGFEAEYQITDTIHAAVGRYNNSVGATSNFLSFGKELESGVIGGVPVTAGLEIGAASGYENFPGSEDLQLAAAGDNTLMGGPYIRIGGKHSIKMRYLVILMAVSYQYGF